MKRIMKYRHNTDSMFLLNETYRLSRADVLIKLGLIKSWRKTKISPLVIYFIDIYSLLVTFSSFTQPPSTCLAFSFPPCPWLVFFFCFVLFLLCFSFVLFELFFVLFCFVLFCFLFFVFVFFFFFFFFWGGGGGGVFISTLVHFINFRHFNYFNHFCFSFPVSF